MRSRKLRVSRRPTPRVSQNSERTQSMMSRNRLAQWLVRAAGLLFTWLLVLPAWAQEHMGAMPPGGGAPPVHHGGGEANLIVPNLADPSIATFMGNTPGATLLYGGIVVSVLGMAFAFLI